jgi:hypothetical protein
MTVVLRTGEVSMFRRGVTLGIALSLLAWVWVRAQRNTNTGAETTIHLPNVADSSVVQSVAKIVDRIEATAPWILKANEKSSTKS